MHLSDGQLRAYRDGQSPPGDAGHVDDCPACRARLAEIDARSQRVGVRFAALAPGPAESPGPSPLALAKLRQRGMVQPREERYSMFKSLLSRRWRPVWAGLSLVAALVFALSFAPVRAWAGQFLGLFRVQQITVLPVDTTRLSELNDDESLGQLMSQVFSSSVTVLKEPGEPQRVASAAEASALAGFNIRLPEGRAPAYLAVQDSTSFEVVFDRDLAQAILSESGRADLQLPASLDGAKITFDIPTGAAAAFGACPDISETEAEAARRLSRGELRTCIVLAQVPSPTVTAPPDLDVAQLAQIGLQFTGMTPEQAADFSQTVDWTTTLVVPIPRNGHSYEQVAVDGVTGNLIKRQTDEGRPDRYTLLWVKDGIVYALSGFGDGQAGLALANALK